MEEPAGKYVTGPLEEFLFLKEMGKKQVLLGICLVLKTCSFL